MKVSYYNRTRGPISVTLRTGTATAIPGKGTLVVSGDEDGSESLAAARSKGDLVRIAIPEDPVPVVAAESVVVVPVIDEITAENSSDESGTQKTSFSENSGVSKKRRKDSF